MSLRTGMLIRSAGMGLLLCVAAAANADVMKWTVDGTPREAIVIAPAKTAASGTAPVIFAFHGHGGNMQEADAGMRFENLWPQAVVVYPQGLPTDPSADPHGYGWVYNTNRYGDRDLKFFDAMLATLRAKFPVNGSRIYATGFSNGAIFSYVLWGTRANVFSAFAPVAGRIIAGVHLTEPKPVLHIGGEQDTAVPFKEQLQAIATARDLNGAAQQGSACGTNCMLYSSSKGAPVETYIHSGGHEFPRGASEMIVNFFKSHPPEH